MPEKLVGAVDLGTTGVRFALYDSKATQIASSYRELPLATPQPGWVEQDPEILLASTITVLNEVLSQRSSAAQNLAAIGLTNQRETVVVWDRESGQPLHPAIVWQDRRTAERCRQLRLGQHRDAIVSSTGLSIDPYFSATKMEWLLGNVPGLRERAEGGDALFGTVDSWILWNLTGNHATDDTNASRTMLYGLSDGGWNPELLSIFSIPAQALPRIQPSISDFGAIKTGSPAEGVPVAGILGDQQASLLGHGIVSSGCAQATWGTGAFLLMNTGPRCATSTHGLLATVARTTPGQSAIYALEGAVFIAGAAIQWLRDGLGVISNSAESASLAQQVESTEGVVFVPALAGLGSPHWDASARGLVVGIARNTRKAHLVRAALEAIAYQTSDVVHAMEADTSMTLNELRVGGGAAANDFLCQFQSDILGIPVVRPRDMETTALGAAFAAGIGAGVWEDANTIRAFSREDQRFEPRMHSDVRRTLLRSWARAVERAKGWAEGAEELA